MAPGLSATLLFDGARLRPKLRSGKVVEGVNPARLPRSSSVHASDLPKHRLVFGDERYSPKSGMRAYPIASYSLIADARRVPVSNTIVVTPRSRASRSRASTR